MAKNNGAAAMLQVIPEAQERDASKRMQAAMIALMKPEISYAGPDPNKLSVSTDAEKVAKKL